MRVERGRAGSKDHVDVDVGEHGHVHDVDGMPLSFVERRMDVNEQHHYWNTNDVRHDAVVDAQNGCG